MVAVSVTELSIEQFHIEVKGEEMVQPEGFQFESQSEVLHGQIWS